VGKAFQLLPHCRPILKLKPASCHRYQLLINILATMQALTYWDAPMNKLG